MYTSKLITYFLLYDNVPPLPLLLSSRRRVVFQDINQNSLMEQNSEADSQPSTGRLLSLT